MQQQLVYVADAISAGCETVPAPLLRAPALVLIVELV